MSEVKTKKCSGCNLVLSVNEYHYKNKSKGKLMPKCKTCIKIINKKNYVRVTVEKRAEYNKRAYLKRRENTKANRIAQSEQITLLVQRLEKCTCGC